MQILVLILRKIIKIVAIRCQILTLKCTKIDEGKGKRRGREGKGRGGEREGKEEREGRGKGPSPPRKKILAPPLSNCIRSLRGKYDDNTTEWIRGKCIEKQHDTRNHRFALQQSHVHYDL